MLKDFVWKCGCQLLLELGALYKSCSMSSAVCLVALSTAAGIGMSWWVLGKTIYERPCTVMWSVKETGEVNFLPFTYPFCTFIHTSSPQCSMGQWKPYWTCPVDIVLKTVPVMQVGQGKPAEGMEPMSQSYLVELSVLAPSGQDAIAEDMRCFAEQLRPLVQLEKVDYKRLQHIP